MSKFKVGDVVEVVYNPRSGFLWVSPMNYCVGKKYKISVVRPSVHNVGDVYNLDGSPWSWDENCFKLVRPSIHFYLGDDNRTVLGVKKVGKEVIKTASATCHPTDEFDFEKGCMIALSRLI